MYADYLRYSQFDRLRHGRHMKAWLAKQAARIGTTTESIFNALLSGYSSEQIEAYAGTPPANTAAPVISGTPTVGQTLTTTDGTWTGAPAFTYQWYRGSTLIPGATGKTYVLVAADLGAMMRCNVIGSSPAGSSTAQSNTLGPVT